MPQPPQEVRSSLNSTHSKPCSIHSDNELGVDAVMGHADIERGQSWLDTFSSAVMRSCSRFHGLKEGHGKGGDGGVGGHLPNSPRMPSGSVDSPPVGSRALSALSLGKAAAGAESMARTVPPTAARRVGRISDSYAGLRRQIGSRESEKEREGGDRTRGLQEEKA